MDAYKTIHGIRVVQKHELEDFLPRIERSALSTEGLDACLSEPLALYVMEYLAAVTRAREATLLNAPVTEPVWPGWTSAAID